MVTEIPDTFNFNTIIALGALAIAGVAIFVKILDKGLSLREHTEFKESVRSQLATLAAHQSERLVIREFNDWRAQINNDLDKVESDIKTIELTRPSSGELKAATDAVSARLAVIEELIKTIITNHRS